MLTVGKVLMVVRAVTVVMEDMAVRVETVVTVVMGVRVRVEN